MNQWLKEKKKSLNQIDVHQIPKATIIQRIAVTSDNFFYQANIWSLRRSHSHIALIRWVSISFLICFTDTSVLDINFCFCIISKNSFTYIKLIDWMKLQYVMRNEHVCLRFYCARWFWWIRGCQQYTVRDRKKNKPTATVWYARTTYIQTNARQETIYARIREVNT